MIPEQIIGKLINTYVGDDGIPVFVHDNFSRNSVFVEFMHSVIESYGMKDLEIINRAKNNRPIAIVDLRCPENETPTSEDIIGVFSVKDGKLSSYEPNHAHHIFSMKGFFQLPPLFHNALFTSWHY